MPGSACHFDDEVLAGEDLRLGDDALVEGEVRLGGDSLEKVSREHLRGHRCCLPSRLCHFSQASRVLGYRAPRSGIVRPARSLCSGSDIAWTTSWSVQ